MKLTDFSTLTFDCYGTLIDWESGILAVLRPWADGHGVDAGDEALLEAFGRHESDLEAGQPFLLYPVLLRRVMVAIGEDYGLTVTDAEAEALALSVKDWPPFPDSAEALGYLAKHYRLAVLSNIDNASFAASAAKLGVTFDAVYTAEDIGAYKPNRRNFLYMIEKLASLGVAKPEILHTAQSLYHDIVPAKALGLATNWIDRRHDKPGAGATRPAAAEPDFRHLSLADFAAHHRASLAS